MKFIKKIVATGMVFLLSIFLFSGCTYRKYELIGIIYEGETEVTKLADITDENLKSYLKLKLYFFFKVYKLVVIDRVYPIKAAVIAP